MSLMDILNQYAGQPQAQPGTEAHFDAAAAQASPGSLAGALTSMFRSDATPAFGQTMGSLFDRSNPQQRAGALNQILQTLGPSVLGAAGGVLGRILGAGAGANGSAGTNVGTGVATGANSNAVTTVTPEQASQLTPAQVQDIATHAEQQDPSIVDRMGAFYAEHPTLVKSLGAGALAFALGSLHRER